MWPASRRCRCRGQVSSSLRSRHSYWEQPGFTGIFPCCTRTGRSAPRQTDCTMALIFGEHNSHVSVSISPDSLVKDDRRDDKPRPVTSPLQPCATGSTHVIILSIQVQAYHRTNQGRWQFLVPSPPRDLVSSLLISGSLIYLIKKDTSTGR
jgi:hypothetical protein